jgi:hypothetical protein
MIRFSGKGWHAAPFFRAHFGLNVCYGKSTSLCVFTSLECVTVGVMKTSNGLVIKNFIAVLLKTSRQVESQHDVNEFEKFFGQLTEIFLINIVCLFACCA